jgi:hypothetical protein
MKRGGLLTVWTMVVGAFIVRTGGHFSHNAGTKFSHRITRRFPNPSKTPCPDGARRSATERARRYSGPPGQLLTARIARTTLPGPQPRRGATDVTTSRSRSRSMCYLAAALRRGPGKTACH